MSSSAPLFIIKAPDCTCPLGIVASEHLDAQLVRFPPHIGLLKTWIAGGLHDECVTLRSLNPSMWFLVHGRSDGGGGAAVVGADDQLLSLLLVYFHPEVLCASG